MTLEDALKAVNKAGFYLMLSENRSGKWRWSAIALGDHPEMTPSGALYTRGCGFGKTYGEALKNLVADLETKKPEPVQTAPDDNFDDLV